jgi:hypothetical protein
MILLIARRGTGIQEPGGLPRARKTRPHSRSACRIHLVLGGEKPTANPNLFRTAHPSLARCGPLVVLSRTTPTVCRGLQLTLVSGRLAVLEGLSPLIQLRRRVSKTPGQSPAQILLSYTFQQRVGILKNSLFPLRIQCTSPHLVQRARCLVILSTTRVTVFCIHVVPLFPLH